MRTCSAASEIVDPGHPGAPDAVIPEAACADINHLSDVPVVPGVHARCMHQPTPSGSCDDGRVAEIDQTDEVAAGLPTGTVTFMLTDVEGSTLLWQERPEAMPAAMARHEEILDEVVTAPGGVRPVEQGEGDSAVVAFAHAVDAVAAAVAVQRRLAAELPWLKVRMAV